MGKSHDLATIQDDGLTVDNGNGNFVYLGNDGALEIRRSGGGGYIDFHGSAVDYDVRIQHHNNGLAFNVGGDGNQITATTIDASGRVTMPYQPAFWAYSTTYSTSGNYPYTNFSIGTGMFNTGNHLNLTTGVFTAPITGKYHFNGVWTDTAGSTSRKIGRFQLNGNSLGEFAEATDQYADIGGSIVVSMAANDTMQVITHPLAFGGCNFSGYLIG